MLTAKYGPIAKKPKTEADVAKRVDPYLYHIKLTYCGRLAGNFIVDWCAKLFEMDQKILIVLEKGKKGTLHWHCQGTTTRSDTFIKHHREEFCKRHSATLENKRRIASGQEPLKHHLTTVSTNEVNATGYQYMMKRGSSVIKQNLFTPEELEELQIASDKHVEKMKKKVADHVKQAVEDGFVIYPRSIDEMPRFVVKIMDYITDVMEQREEKQSIRHFKIDLLKALAQNCSDDKLRTWLRCELFGIKHP